jgi:hypothetical protein
MSKRKQVSGGLINSWRVVDLPRGGRFSGLVIAGVLADGRPIETPEVRSAFWRKGLVQCADGVTYDLGVRHLGEVSAASAGPARGIP